MAGELNDHAESIQLTTMLAPRKRRFSATEYTEKILAGDRFMLSRAITLTESNLPSDAELANEVMERLIQHTGNSIRIGITGVPGVGKSTFIEVFGQEITARGKKVAVLAIDPSSQRSRGSIMGDKTRMEALSRDPNAFIRPSCTGDTLGGVARKTREAMLLCEAAGFEVILVETVGVGQSEITVKGMVDFFLLLMLAGAGDELQGIKKGIMEMADAIAITKADGENYLKARQAKAEYKNALHLFRSEPSGWTPRVLICSAVERSNISTLYSLTTEFQEKMKQNGWLQKNRMTQHLDWMHETVRETLISQFYAREEVQAKRKQIEQQVQEGRLPAYSAARMLLNL
jgi:LAO/AO transport system kinase